MIRLHDYWRSGAAYRVRIALNLKGIAYESIPHDLRQGAQRDGAYLAINPQGLVPALETGGITLTQSLAIIEWLEEIQPFPPLLPATAGQRAIVRAMAQTICCDIHPINNLRVLNAIRGDFGADESTVRSWIHRWTTDGFAALEPLIERYGQGFAFGDNPTMADCCLVPQVYAAHRFDVPLHGFPSILSATRRCQDNAAFASAHPDAQPDADRQNAGT